MKKRFRRKISLLLAAALSFSMNVQAFAVEAVTVPVQDGTAVTAPVEAPAVLPAETPAVLPADIPAVSPADVPAADPVSGTEAPAVTPSAPEIPAPAPTEEEQTVTDPAETAENEAGVSANEPAISENEAEEAAGENAEPEATLDGKSDTLAKLIAGIKDTEEHRIELIKNVSLNGLLTIDNGKNIIIDLKGYTISGNGAVVENIDPNAKFLISVNGAGTGLKLTDSNEGGAGSVSANENNISCIAVLGGAVFETKDARINGGTFTGVVAAVNNAVITINEGEFNGPVGSVLTGAKIIINGGLFNDNISVGDNDAKITISGGSFNGRFSSTNSANIVLSGGKYADTFENDLFTYTTPADGYGMVVDISDNAEYKYEVSKATNVYIAPRLDESYVLIGQTLSQAGLSMVLKKEDGTVVEGVKISGGQYQETDENGAPKNPAAYVSGNTVYSETGVHYLAALDLYPVPNPYEPTLIVDAENPKKIYSGIYNIKNAETISKNHLFKFEVQSPEEDTLSIEEVVGKSIFYNQDVKDPFEYFNIKYTHNGTTKLLNKNSGVEILWSLSLNAAGDDLDEASPVFAYKGQSALTPVYIKAKYLEQSKIYTSRIEKQPVAIKGKSISSLRGQELTPRYYQGIYVYALSDDRVTETKMVSENSLISDWTDVTSTVLDLTGISNLIVKTYTVEMTDIRSLNDVMGKNYELVGRGHLEYSVDPSVILNFKGTSGGSDIAERKVVSTDTDKVSVYSFTNGKSTTNAQWMVKQVSFDSIRMTYYERIISCDAVGITAKPTVDGKGTVFTLDKEMMKNGGEFTLYEIFPSVKIATDSNTSLTVTTIMPVIYTGEKFVASDDTGYYINGVPKVGVSPTLDVKVLDGKKRLKFGTDYSISYKNNINAGSDESEESKIPTVIINGKGDYTGMKITAYFTILPADFAMMADIEVKNQYVRYNNSVLKPTLNVKYKTGAKAGKKMSARDYSIIIYDKNGRNVTDVKYNNNENFAKYNIAITASGKNENFTGTTDTSKFFYGIPKTSRTFSIGGINKKVNYIPSGSVSMESFIKQADFYAKASTRKFNYADYKDKNTISIDLVDNMDENVAVSYADTSVSNAGIYYLKIEFANFADKYEYRIYEPTYVKVNYTGKALTNGSVKLKKTAFNYDGNEKYHDLTLRMTKGIMDQNRLSDISVRVYQTGETYSLEELKNWSKASGELEAVIPGKLLNNSNPGRYMLEIRGKGYYSGKYVLTYMVGVQKYSSKTTPAMVYVNTVSSDDAEDTVERAVPYKSDSNYDDDMVKVVWTYEKGGKQCLKRAADRTADTGDYYVEWGTFKQVGEKKGSVTIVGTGTYFTGKIKKTFDVTQATQ